MDAWVWVVIVIAVIAIAAVAWAIWRQRQTARLQQQFGPEWDRVHGRTGTTREARRELKEREARRASFDIRPLSPISRERYVARWQDVQAMFVDSPEQAARDADGLIVEIMRERGYPIEDFDQRAADLSVDHPNVVENYRAAHGTMLAFDAGRATTEDLRRALVHYRSLFEEMVEEPRDERMRRTG